MISDEMAALLMLGMWGHWFMSAWAFCHDGKSAFWTGYLDIATLRVLWRR